jgi:hypothetical protein
MHICGEYAIATQRRQFAKRVTICVTSGTPVGAARSKAEERGGEKTKENSDSPDKHETPNDLARNTLKLAANLLRAKKLETFDSSHSRPSSRRGTARQS